MIFSRSEFLICPLHSTLLGLVEPCFSVRDVVECLGIEAVLLVDLIRLNPNKGGLVIDPGRFPDPCFDSVRLSFSDKVGKQHGVHLSDVDQGCESSRQEHDRTPFLTMATTSLLVRNSAIILPENGVACGSFGRSDCRTILISWAISDNLLLSQAADCLLISYNPNMPSQNDEKQSHQANQLHRTAGYPVTWRNRRARPANTTRIARSPAIEKSLCSSEFALSQGPSRLVSAGITPH